VKKYRNTLANDRLLIVTNGRQLADAGTHLEIQIVARNNLALTLGTMGQTGAALRSNLADMLHQSGDETAAPEQIRQSVTIYAVIGQAHDNSIKRFLTAQEKRDLSPGACGRCAVSSEPNTSQIAAKVALSRQ